MNRPAYKSALFALVLLLVSPWFGRAGSLDPAQLDRAFGQLQTYTWGQPADALVMLDEAVAAAQTDPVARRKLEQRLVVVLQSNAPVAAKQIVCRKLALVGSRSSVEALASLLTQDEVSHMARFALERIPEAAAGSALLEALPKTRGPLKVGVINSLGARAEKTASTALAALLQDNEPVIVGAAAAALGRIGTREAVRALEAFHAAAPPLLQPVVNDAFVAGLEKLAGGGDRQEASRIFRQMYEHESGFLRLAGFRGLVQVEPGQARQLLSQALAGADEPLRGQAVTILAGLPGPAALQPFLESWRTLPTEGQLALLQAVRWRHDANAQRMAVAACTSKEPTVRLAAVRTLGFVGRAGDVALLAKLAESEQAEERQAARAGLAAVPGREPTQAIADLLPGASSALRAELIRALAVRGATECAPKLVPYLQDQDAATRQAALETVAALGDERQVPAVIGFLKAAPDDAGRSQADKALRALVGRTGQKSVEALLSALAGAKPAAQLILLEQLGTLGGSRALAAVRAAVGGEDAGVREGAFRVLAAWPDWEAAPDLLKCVGSSDQAARRSLAFQGYVRLCRETPMSAPDRLARLSEAARLAAGDREKLQVSAALADVPDAGALKLLAGYLDEPALVDAAGLAVAKVATGLDARDKDQVVALLQRVVKLSRNADVQKQAREALKKFGVAEP